MNAQLIQIIFEFSLDKGTWFSGYVYFKFSEWPIICI